MFCRSRPAAALLLPLLLSVACADDPVVTQLDLSAEVSRLTHLRLSPGSGQVYVAGVNRIYQLSSTLARLQEVVTGPRQDNPLSCPASGCPADVATEPTDNVNKVLVVDQESRTLLACGSVLQGACTKYDLNNISLPSQDLPEAIAANDANSSTVAFIGPEHYHAWGASNVLYVATTFTLVGIYRNTVPAISTRRLDNLDFAERSFNKHSMLTVDVKYRDHFLVEYVYGFHEKDYAYFLTVQRRSHLPGQQERGYISRIVRTCVTDANYDSYVEMTLSCGGDNLLQAARVAEPGDDLSQDAGILDGDRVLVAAFSPSQGFTNEPQEQSNVCVFSMKEIEEKFEENIHMCFNGSMQYRNMEYISGPILDGQCPKAGTTGNIYHFCSEGLKISAVHPLTAEPVLSWDQRVTSVAVTSTGRHTVALLGTQQGTLKKVLVSSMRSARQYAELPVDPGSPVLADMQVDLPGEHVYVPTTQKVTLLRLQTCEQYTNCTECLQTGDPYCGWCSLEKRCTVRSECGKADSSSPRWLSIDAGQQCIDMERIEPQHIAIDQQAQIYLGIRALPPLRSGAKYQCVFGSAPPVDATATVRGLRCPAPPLSLRPLLAPSADHVTVPLSVRSSETKKDFVTRQFVYFDCGRHTTCGSCVTSQWQCSWCVYDNKCVNDNSTCHRHVVSARHKSEMLSPSELGCPAVVPPRQPILVADEVAHSLVLEVTNLPSPLAGQSSYTCVIVIEGRTVLVPGRLDAGQFIVCEKRTYFYRSNASELTATATVKWNYNNNIGSVNFTLYKCALLATHQGSEDCSLCLTRDPRYRCQWCGGQCRFSEQCRQNPVRECPRPQVDRIHPRSGPLEGGTLLTIEGRNLGLHRNEVTGRIFVGRVPCDLVDYEVSVKVMCRTGAVTQPAEETVKLGNSAGFTVSDITFQYKRVELLDFQPRLGPQSGGTLVTLTGSNLHVGSNVTVTLGGRPCPVTERLDGVTCVTAPSVEPRDVTDLRVTVDGANRSLAVPFTYTPDPVVLDIRPLKSYVSGGRPLTVHGRQFDSIQQPKIIVFNETALRPINTTVCTVLTPELMECPSPAVPRLSAPAVPEPELLRLGESRAARMYRSPDTQLPTPPQQELQIGFLMDNVKGVLNLKQFSPELESTITYVEDPVYFPFAKDVKAFSGDTLVIEGVNLNGASDERDTAVTVGGVPCNVTTLTATQLVCVPPRRQSDGMLLSEQTGLPLVQVTVGNLRFPLGHLQYDGAGPFKLSGEVIAGIAAGAVVLVLASLLILLVYRRKSTQVEREYKRIQIQMDTLENNIRSECKQAFAAMCTWDSRRGRDTLAAASPDLPAQLSSLAATFNPDEVDCLEQREFLVKVLFPGIAEHPILSRQRPSSPTSPRTSLDVAMLQLEQLVRNQHFLVTVIDTMERQKDFSIRDRVTVASLLTVILMTNMEYLTTVLHQLLVRHISRIARSRHPHLMLRRTETVMEKLLTNWISVCLYGHIRERLSSRLYLLTKAIKHQISCGPVDAVTLEAHYSLAEERLLRPQIEHNSVTLLVTTEETPYERIPCNDYQSQPRHYEDVIHKVTVHALDCDSISQVKQKVVDAVFCGLPASQRPSHHCVALVWLTADGQRTPLADEDATSRTVDGWRQINTLSHYGINKIATMFLVQARETVRTKKYNTPSSVGSFSLPSAFSPLVGSNIYVKPGAEIRVYHLVRPEGPAGGGGGSGGQETAARAVPEVFLTRLLATKAMLQPFIDTMASALLTPDEEPPPVVKWLFDVLDEEAERQGMDQPDILHAWKANCLPLRMWANLIRRPELIFDLDKSPAVESSLTVISQSLVEACLPTPHTISKNSPSHKLVFAKDIGRWQCMVGDYFESVRSRPPVSDQDLAVLLQQLSRHHAGQFDAIAALKELYIYITKYGEPIAQALDSEPTCQQLFFSSRLSNIAASLEMPIC
ncbi:plexin-B-like [Amphibalanus amphitrite]|uniref:plexin-B-like n=1 Tax=Amphibalanus amphitrite TaxID=1232801 RepID=UPI001C9048A3|nr:plexin-B-like [Amphibalanus amphitrite]